mmetsp:Transcript_51119/g.128313  ORF Transcript_51119/g.128313 Transcript_51119/m.128313 type:complete len:226 (-) Transcript_51119:110-787(-)
MAVTITMVSLPELRRRPRTAPPPLAPPAASSAPGPTATPLPSGDVLAAGCLGMGGWMDCAAGWGYGCCWWLWVYGVSMATPSMVLDATLSMGNRAGACEGCGGRGGMALPWCLRMRMFRPASHSRNALLSSEQISMVRVLSAATYSMVRPLSFLLPTGPAAYAGASCCSCWALTHELPGRTATIDATLIHPVDGGVCARRVFFHVNIASFSASWRILARRVLLPA